LTSEVKDGCAVVTHWKDIYIVSVFYFFAYVTYQALTIPLYSYLKEIDRDVPIEFYGFITSAFKFLPGRRYVVLLVFILHAVAEGSIIIVRSYVPRISTPADRSAAYGVKNGSVLLSILAGPMIQLLFSLIPFPKGGVILYFDWLKLNAFTGTIWLILLFNIAALYAVAFHIREPSEMKGETVDQPGITTLIAMCMVEKAISGGGFAALFTILNPYITTTFNYPIGQALLILAVGSVACGFFSIVTACLFIFARLGTRIPSSKSFPISLVLCLLMFFMSYPFPIISEKVPVKSGE
ncbi:hypothetical protein PFISCL1PPCAC_4677, partial [Pristionchus fissidentatus]